jgi:hypothetical protein
VQKIHASGYSEIHTYSQFLVTASDGYMSLMAEGNQSAIDIQAGGVDINTGGAYLQVLNSETGGSIIQSASGDSACISLETPTDTVGSNILVTPKGIALTFGLPETLATIGLTSTGLTLSVGPQETGSLIQMTPDSILLKVGETEFALTADGIVAKAPLVETFLRRDQGHRGTRRCQRVGGGGQTVHQCPGPFPGGRRGGHEHRRGGGLHLLPHLHG